MTIIEKIFTRASGKPVKPRDLVWVNLDLVVMRDFGGPNVVQEYESYFGKAAVFDKNKVAITFDLHIPARDEKVASNQKLLRDFANRQGVRLFEVNSGVGQHVLFESGQVMPGNIVVGTDSHMNLLGALGAAGFGMGTTDIAAAMSIGKLWFKIPATMKIVLTGTLGKYVTAKDVILHILHEFGTSGALNLAVEFAGEFTAALDLAQRITICSMVTEMSGDVGFIELSDEIAKFIESRSGKKAGVVTADKNASYEKVLEFDVSTLPPLVACPHSPDNVKRAEELSRVRVNQVFIGSCTNGRFEDLKLAAQILKGKKIKEGVRLIVVPATMEVARQALKHGLLDIFMDSGAVVTNPGCALCTTGHPGILAPGEVMLSTSNRNFIGKLGKGGEVYLGSPAVAAATALTGKITDPRELV